MILALKQSFIDGLTYQFDAFSATARVYIGRENGVLYTDGVNVWHCWHDDRFTMRDAVHFATLSAHVDEFPEIVVTYDSVEEWLLETYDVHYPTGMEDDPWAAVIELNGADPNIIYFGNGLPGSWFPYSDDE